MEDPPRLAKSWDGKPAGTCIHLSSVIPRTKGFMSAETHPFTFIDPVCKQPAFHRSSVPKFLDPVVHTEFEHLDGSSVEMWDQSICESCRRLILVHMEYPAMIDPANYQKRAV
jgi:hypothetical protein